MTLSPSSERPLLAPAHPQNYGDRRASPIDMIVLHTTEGSFESAVAWFADEEAHASAHYVVAHDGRVALCVAESSCAWHCGNGPYNRRSIGIEIEGHSDDPHTFSGAGWPALIMLVGDIAKRHGIPLDRLHIIGHAEVPDPRVPGLLGGVNHHTDPGPFFPWVELVNALRAMDPVA